MKYIKSVILCFFGFVAQAQNLVGEVEYRYKIFYDQIYSSQSFISPQEKDRILLSWNNQEGYSTRMKLQFSPESSLYTYGEPYELNNYSWHKEEYIIENNLKDKKVMKYMETMGRPYIIRDELNPRKWRVMNEIRDILGHMCMKAISEDTLKNQKIVAWFAADIPVATGPEELNGLPGLILAYDVNEGMLSVEAEKITLGEPKEPIKLPKKLKGKEVNQQEYNALMAEFISNSVKQKRSWVWEVRY